MLEIEFIILTCCIFFNVKFYIRVHFVVGSSSQVFLLHSASLFHSPEDAHVLWTSMILCIYRKATHSM